MRRSFRLVSALLILLPCLFAQFGSGIQGTIVDGTGAVIPNVQVVVTNVATGVTREVLTSDLGIFRVLSLGAGTYSVKATKEGFSAAEQVSVELAANEIRKVDFGMKVSGLAETVNVGAQVEALETEQGRISARITGAQLKELPIPNRNIVNLMALQPGVSGRSLGNELLGSDATPQFNANGMRPDGNSFTLDDSNINSISRGGRAEVTPNVETVAEVRVVTNNFSAEQGRNMGAQVSIVTKSGTNQFHGSLWDYHTNNVLQDRNIFDTTSRVPVNRRNQFGYGVGGPIIRNKTFFYTTYEGVRRSGDTVSTATVETPQLRNWVLQNRPNSIAAYFMGKFFPVADPTINVRDVGGPDSRRKQVQFHAGRHSRYRHRAIPHHHRCALEPIHDPRRSRIASGQGPPVWLLLSPERAHHHAGNPPGLPAAQPDLGPVWQPGLLRARSARRRSTKSGWRRRGSSGTIARPRIRRIRSAEDCPVRTCSTSRFRASTSRVSGRYAT